MGIYSIISGPGLALIQRGHIIEALWYIKLERNGSNTFVISLCLNFLTINFGLNLISENLQNL